MGYGMGSRLVHIDFFSIGIIYLLHFGKPYVQNSRILQSNAMAAGTVKKIYTGITPNIKQVGTRKLTTFNMVFYIASQTSSESLLSFYFNKKRSPSVLTHSPPAFFGFFTNFQNSIQ
jgi:hypothetical protein